MMPSQSSSINAVVRLDKWLWAARFYKTRALAQEMVKGGKVHYNGQRCKPSRQVEIGATLKLRQGLDEKEVEVLHLSAKRGNASLAQTMYRETPESLANRERRAMERKLVSANAPPDSRPDKKQRRQIIRFKQQD